MANKFVENMEKEVKAVEEEKIVAKAAEIAKENAELYNNTSKNTIIETVKDVKNKEYYITKTEDNRPANISGNCESRVVNINGRMCYVCGKTPEEMKEDADYIRLALARGDINLPNAFGYTLSGRYVTKIVSIYGTPCLTVGTTEEARQEDEAKARICKAKLKNSGAYEVLTAEQLIEAGLNPTKEFEKEGYKFIYFADQKCARNFEGEKVADISDIKDKLSVDTAIELLKARIELPVYEEDEYDDSYDDYDDDCDDCCGDCSECWNDDCEEREDW